MNIDRTEEKRDGHCHGEINHRQLDGTIEDDPEHRSVHGRGREVQGMGAVASVGAAEVTGDGIGTGRRRGARAGADQGPWTGKDNMQ